MKRTKLRFLFTVVWLINIYMQFGFLYTVLPKTDGNLSLRWLSIVSLLFLFSLILVKDVLMFNRLIFLRIIAFCFLFFAGVYVVLIFLDWNLSSLIYLSILVPTLLSGLAILRKIKQIN